MIHLRTKPWWGPLIFWDTPNPVQVSKNITCRDEWEDWEGTETRWNKKLLPVVFQLNFWKPHSSIHSPEIQKWPSIYYRFITASPSSSEHVPWGQGQKDSNDRILKRCWKPSGLALADWAISRERGTRESSKSLKLQPGCLDDPKNASPALWMVSPWAGVPLGLKQTSPWSGHYFWGDTDSNHRDHSLAVAWKGASWSWPFRIF